MQTLEFKQHFAIIHSMFIDSLENNVEFMFFIFIFRIRRVKYLLGFFKQE